jgi:hypothetical protein
MMNDNESTALIDATIGNTGNGVVFEAEIGGSSTAEINRDNDANIAEIEKNEETRVFAEANTDLDVIAIAPSGGGIAGAGTSVKLNSNVAVNTNVYNANISAEEITVNATTTPKLYALATADVIGGTAVGLTLSEVKIADDVTVNVGDGVVLNADDTIDISAEFKNPEAGYNAYVEAIAGSGGVITGAVTVTNITMDTKSVVNIGKSNNISAQSLYVLSKHEDSFNYQNLSIGAAGASGLGSENTVSIISDSTVNIADDETVNINGDDFIGTITIPSINLELPVMSEYSYSKLKKAPCRYYGNLFTNDLIICAHAYETFFANLLLSAIGFFTAFFNINSV